MKDFILRKWDIIKEESDKKAIHPLIVLINKAFTKIVLSPFHFLDLIFCLLIFPFLVIVVFLSRNSKKTKNIFFIGLEHVINKTAERGIGYQEKGYKTFIFSFEWSGMKHSLPYEATINKYTRSIAFDTILFAQSLLKHKPSYIEVYFEGDVYRQLFAVILSDIFQSVIISIERGVWHGFKESRIPYLMGWRYIHIFRLSDKVFYRELGLFEIYDKYKLPRSKFYFDYNKVKVYEEPDFNKNYPTQNVLFLNGFKSFRRLDLLIKAIPLVRAKVPNVEFSIIGARIEEDIQYVNRELNALGIKDHVEVGYWDPKPKKFYERASVFVLPATLVFCNFSLIEAMERGIPAVVTGVEDADKIIDHDIDGILCDMSEESIAQSIVELLHNEVKRQEIGKNARLKIIHKFNSDKRLDPIVEIIEKNFF